MTDLILASGSPFRRALLERLKVPFRTLSPEVDEEQLKIHLASSAPPELTQKLAQAKAHSIARLNANSIVIGSDQVVAFEGQILGKPKSPENAVAQLSRLQGKSHELLTATCVVYGNDEILDLNRTTMHMRPLTAAQIERYVKADEPLQSAGSYMFEKLGISLFERIQSEDETAIQGLPLIFVCSAINRFGISLP